MVVQVILQRTSETLDELLVIHRGFRQEVHELKEVVLYLVRLIGWSVGARDEKLNWTIVVGISSRDNGQPFLEDFNEDDRANFFLLVHIFLDKLDEELIDLDLEIRRDIAQVLRF